MLDRWWKESRCPNGTTCERAGSIVVSGPSAPGQDLGKLIGETGGAQFWMRDADDVPSVAQEIADELHQQYLLAFAPAKLDGRVHKMEVKTVRGGLQVQSRRSYQAVAQ